MGPSFYMETKSLSLLSSVPRSSRLLLRAATFALILDFLPLRRVSGEDRVDTKFL